MPSAFRSRMQQACSTRANCIFHHRLHRLSSPLMSLSLAPTMNPGPMEVDPDALPQVLGPSFTLEPAVASPHPQQDAIDKLNLSMNNELQCWPHRIALAGDDLKKRENVFAQILSAISAEASSRLVSNDDAEKLIQSLDKNGLKEWQDGVDAGIKLHDWAILASHPILGNPSPEEKLGIFQHDPRDYEKILASSYITPFVGDTARDLVKYLEYKEREIASDRTVVYAKAFSVVQSSGTGKSRMLTEAGKYVFTLPICIRDGRNPGYPPPDLEVVKYFDFIEKGNDLSFGAHIVVACFIAAAHTTMYKWLKKAQDENVEDLRVYWHDHMEPSGDRDFRNRFFSEVVVLANSLQCQHQNLREGESPKRTKKVDNANDSKTITQFASIAYRAITQNATTELMEFLFSINRDTLCVTYFDEAHGMGRTLWVLLRLLQFQNRWLKMWCIFLVTKSSISYYAPGPNDMGSLRLIQEIARPVRPYLALGFDHHAIFNAQKPRTVTMGELQTIGHLVQYGRPLWKAQYHKEDFGLIKFAGEKLMAGMSFSAKNKHHVFAVLSQRLCLDPVLSDTEAVELADRSVAHHMRLRTGLSDNGAMSYTHSPSEPMLALGSAYLLYDTPNGNLLPTAIRTLCVDLCSAGLVEKGIMGELAARTLLLVARDFASPMHHGRRDLLKPVVLLDFLDGLFGDEWAGGKRPKFETVFASAYVNFSHWIVTKDPLPLETDSKLLANLWARGAALQCYFYQKGINITIPVYDGPIDSKAVLDPFRFSGISVQIKFQVSGEPQAESRIQPFGIPRDPNDPLPYLALLMELGTESNYKVGGKIKVTASGPTLPGGFSELTTALKTAKDTFDVQKVGRNQKDPELKKLKEVVSNAQVAADSYNRYAISVRGASPEVYQVLKKAQIVEEFATLLNIATPLSGEAMATMEHMRPLERLKEGNHTVWMAEYVAQAKMELD